MMEYLVLAIGMLAMLMLLYLCFVLCPSRRGVPEELKCAYAHRGLHGKGIPENSLPALAMAMTMGASFLF